MEPIKQIQGRHMSRVHFICRSDTCVAFCPDNLVTLKIRRTAKAALEKYIKTGDLPEAAKSAGIPDRYLNDIVSKLGRGENENIGHQDCSTVAGGTRKKLDRLVIHVSNDCNLRCLYCYADGGAYGKRRERHMPLEIAISAVNWALSVFDEIENIQFFGGEPLLNPRLIIQVCEYLIMLRKTGKITRLPRFGLVTNGTQSSDEIIDILKRYQINTTISLDGPAHVHDKLRGKGSFEKADRFARQCLKTPGIKTQFQCTWTPVHLKNNISITHLVDFFYRRFNHRILHTVPVSVSPGNDLYLSAGDKSAALNEAARYTVANLVSGVFKGNTLSYRIIEAVRKQKPIKSYCPAGMGTLAVSVDGGVYPCFMFVGDDNLRILRITADGKLTDFNADQISRQLHLGSKHSHAKCRCCWARNLCGNCLGNDLVESRSILKRVSCDIIKSMISTILLELADRS